MNNTYTGVIDTFFSLKALSLPPLYFLLLLLFFLFLPSLPLYDLSLSTPPPPDSEKCQGPLAPPKSPRAQLRREDLQTRKLRPRKGEWPTRVSPGSGRGDLGSQHQALEIRFSLSRIGEA